jgi:hypothetical protein
LNSCLAAFDSRGHEFQSLGGRCFWRSRYYKPHLLTALSFLHLTFYGSAAAHARLISKDSRTIAGHFMVRFADNLRFKEFKVQPARPAWPD